MNRAGFLLIALLYLGCADALGGEATPADFIERFRIFLLTNLPNDFSCRIEMKLFPSPDRDGLHVNNGIPALRFRWRFPSTANLFFVTHDSRGTCWLEKSLAPLMNRINAFGSASSGKVSIIDLVTLTLLSDQTACICGKEKVDGVDCAVLRFDNLPLPLPRNVATHAFKLWLARDSGKPMRLRMFASDFVTTWTLKYRTVTDGRGNRFSLPDYILVEPSLGENEESTALPFRIEFSEYRIPAGARGETGAEKQ